MNLFLAIVARVVESKTQARVQVETFLITKHPAQTWSRIRVCRAVVVLLLGSMQTAQMSVKFLSGIQHFNYYYSF